jgi:hypothetical protein
MRAAGQRFRTLRVPMLLLAMLFAAEARAATVTVLAGTLTEGNANIGFPLNATLFRQIPMRYQQVYSAGYFAHLSGDYAITAIAFRTDGAVGRSFATTLADIRIDLSTTSAKVDALDMTFGANVGDDVQTVFDGALSISSAHRLTTDNAREFDVVIRFSRPFRFTVGSGNLLLDIFNYSGGLTSQLDGTKQPGDGMSRLLGDDVANGRLRDSTGLMTQFTMEPIATPVPGAVYLLLGPFAALLMAARRRGAVAQGA